MLINKQLTDEHIEAFVPLEEQSADCETLYSLYYKKDKKGSFAIIADDEVVLIMGIREKWNNVYDTFTIFSPNWKPIYYREVLMQSKDYFSKLKYDRIEHLISCDRPWTDKMASMFGFTYAATLRKYINGKDYKLYEIVK